MKKNYEEVKMSVYAGMSIFELIKDYKIKLDYENISLEDKKFLALYLGIFNTQNKISMNLEEIYLKSIYGMDFNFLTQEQYSQIYNAHFIDIMEEINFESIEQHANYLLSKKVVQDFSKYSDYYLELVKKDRNKQLVKTIN